MAEAILKKIAEKAGVSTTTAFRALDGHPYVKAELREKILRVANELGYVPPKAAKKRQIAVLVSANPDAYLSLYRTDILGKIVAACGLRGIGVEALTSDNLELLDEHFLRVGVIFQSTFDAKLLDAHTNTAFYSMNSLHKHFPGVMNDEEQAVRMGLEHLYARGHRRIAVAVPVGQSDPVVKLRLAIYEVFAEEHNLVYRKVLRIVPQERDSQGWINDVFADGGADAVFALGEDMLLSLYYGLTRRGVRIPEDLSVMAFESDVAGFLKPAITTVAQDVPAYITTMLDWVEKALDGKAPRTKIRKKIPARLIERESVRKIS